MSGCNRIFGVGGKTLPGVAEGWPRGLALSWRLTSTADPFLFSAYHEAVTSPLAKAILRTHISRKVARFSFSI